MLSESTNTDKRIAALEKALEEAREQVVAVEKERDTLRISYERLRLELELLRRRMFFAKSERVDTAQLELEFAQKLRALDEIAGTLGLSESDDDKTEKRKRTSKGRRDLRQLPIEEKRIEIEDPLMESLVAEGKAAHAGHEESCKLAWQRGGMRRVVIARVKYSTVGADGESAIETAPMPPELIFRCLVTASLLAHIIIAKHCDGLPLFRLERRFERDGVPLDSGTMSRWLEHIGATFGATIVEAMRKEALRTAFCIATDATGVAVQPEPTKDGQRQACRRGHYFVQVADKDAIFSSTHRGKPVRPSERCLKASVATCRLMPKVSKMFSFETSRKTSPPMATSSKASGKKLRVGRTRGVAFGRRPSARMSLRAKASRALAASSSSMPPGRANRMPR